MTTGSRDRHVAYSCGGNLYVFNQTDQPAIDKSAPVWTALVGEIATGGTAPAQPVRKAVETAYYAA